MATVETDFKACPPSILESVAVADLWYVWGMESTSDKNPPLQHFSNEEVEAAICIISREFLTE